ncbi:virulence factor TspB C-terminal domain-related protein, partial [Pseudomonas amygdali]|uniref:virulence factor TspB C-terminal domain-related protein n=1 Tax=Pseudomonas amygdali TaxID=47877 RepID=UPI00396745C8
GVGSGGASGNGSGSGGGGEEDDGGSASASDDCTVPPKCDGDAYLCSILRQEYLDSCAERALPSDKQKAELKALIEKQQTEIDGNQKSMDDKVTSLVNQFQSASSGGASGGQCFQDKTFSVQGASFTMPFSQACGVLEWFRYAVLAVAYLISLRIVTKEL